MSQHITRTLDLEILVVGGGPTGMVVASELKRYGMQVRMIDQLPQPSHTSKALAIQARTLELFEKMGIAERMVARGVKLTALNFSSHHRRLAQIQMRAVKSRYPFLLSLPQWETEQILCDRLTQQGIEVERGVTLTALQQTTNGVDVVLEHLGGQREQVHTRWLIGCDGPHSTVRHQLGLPFEGWTFAQSFALADVHMDAHLPGHQAFFFWQAGDLVACFPLPEGQYRFIIGYRPQTGPVGEVTLEELQDALDRCGWSEVRVDDMVWTSRFHVNQRKVRHYRQGSVFLAGDACHIHSPIGGQGMNTGMQDAFNLAWKLALVSRGEAHPHVLNSYEAERERFGRQLLRGTDLFSHLVLLQDPLFSRVRDHILPLVLSLRPVRKWIATRIAQIDVSYGGSPIVSEYAPGYREVPGIWRSIQPGCHAGERAPDAQISLGETPARVHTLFLDTHHVLFFFAHRRHPERSLPAWQELDAFLKGTYNHLVEAWLILPQRSEEAECLRGKHLIYDEDAALAHAYGMLDEGLALVRPDGYLGFLSRPFSLEQVRAYLASILVSVQTHLMSPDIRGEVESRR